MSLGEMTAGSFIRHEGFQMWTRGICFAVSSGHEGLVSRFKVSDHERPYQYCVAMKVTSPE